MKSSTDKSIDKCAGILGRCIRARNESLSAPATLALRTLIQLKPESYAKYIHLLAQSMGEIHASPARAEIIWLVGEYASQLGSRAADVLRLSLQDFADQEDDVKYQIITLAAKVYTLYFPDPPVDVDSLDTQLQQVHLLYGYAMSLARYDTSYDFRDRMRLLKSIQSSTYRGGVLHSSKPVPHMESVGEKGAEWMLGSMAQVISRDTEGQLKLPEWGSEIPPKGVRDVQEPARSQTATPVSSSSQTAGTPAREESKREKKVWKDLDKFYASESEEEDSEEEEEDEEEEAEEEEEGDEEEDAEEGVDEEEDEEEDTDEETDEDEEDASSRHLISSAQHSLS